ncbi:MAG: mechanosensitive ion channel [Pirellulaceae bacterium]
MPRSRGKYAVARGGSPLATILYLILATAAWGQSEPPAEAPLQPVLNPPVLSTTPPAGGPVGDAATGGATVPASAPATTSSLPSATAPATPPPAAAVPLTAADIEARRKEAEESPDLADDVKKRIADLYRQALEQIQQLEQSAELGAKHKADADNVQSRVREIRREQETLQGGVVEPVADAPLSELEPKLSAKELQLNELKGVLDRLVAEPAARATRRKDLRALLLAAPQKLEELKKQLDTPPPADEPPLLTQARRTELAARRALTEKQLPVWQNELARYDAEEAADFIRAQRDLVAMQIATTQKEFDLHNQAVRRKRDEAAVLAVRQAQEEVVRAHPLLRPLAEENQQYAEATQTLTGSLAEVEASLKRVKERYEEVQRQLTQTKKKVDSVGLTGPIGLMLRKQRGELPDLRRRRHNVQQRGQLIDTAQLALFEYDDERSLLANPDPLVRKLLSSEASDLSREKRARLEDAARHVLDRKCEYLDTLIRSNGKYFDTLVELDTTERQLIDLTEQYQGYIDERVLWIRSSKPLYNDLRLDPSDLEALAPAAWLDVGGRIWEDARNQPFIYLGALVLLAILLALGMRWRRQIRALGEVAQRGTCYRFLPTGRTAVQTALISVPWPAVFFFWGWRLSPLADGDELMTGLAEACWLTAWTYLPLELMRQTCRAGGLAEAHFGWPTSATLGVRRNLRWILLFSLPLVLLTTTLQASDPEHGHDVFERVGLIVGSMLMMFFLFRLLSPNSAGFREMTAYQPGGWLDRFKHVWCWAGVTAAGSIGALSLFGYHYTARQLAFRLFISICLMLALVVARALLMRLVLMVRRKFTIEEARRRRASSGESSPSQSVGAGLSPQAMIGVDPQAPDYQAHSAQTKRLLATAMVAASLIGLWLVWSDVVPALRILDHWTLWTTTVSETEIVAATADAPETTVTRDVLRSITLADVGLALIIASVTFASARNIPGLLEMAVLQRLPLENSVRYAITTLASYAIVLVGVIAGCKTVGLYWSQIQWLATALTFGLAFGLQEMFANFVAGLILLFERPIRVGDIVTIDDTSGVVSRIRIRATTIINWDRKEFIVPNKEFITGKLLNWTLSDQVNRVVVEVGVKYGSDTDLVRELLLKAARENPLVLDNPPPLATFEGFGDSCLNFCLRAFLPSLENRLQVIHELHTTVDKLFRQSDIEIPFPQRDLNVRTIPAGVELFAADRQPVRESSRKKEAA